MAHKIRDCFRCLYNDAMKRWDKNLSCKSVTKWLSCRRYE